MDHTTAVLMCFLLFQTNYLPELSSVFPPSSSSPQWTKEVNKFTALLRDVAFRLNTFYGSQLPVVVRRREWEEFGDLIKDTVTSSEHYS